MTSAVTGSDGDGSGDLGAGGGSGGEWTRRSSRSASHRGRPRRPPSSTCPVGVRSVWYTESVQGLFGFSGCIYGASGQVSLHSAQTSEGSDLQHSLLGVALSDPMTATRDILDHNASCESDNLNLSFKLF